MTRRSLLFALTAARAFFLAPWAPVAVMGAMLVAYIAFGVFYR